MAQFLENTVEINKIDEDIKNKFKLSWLAEKDANGDFLSDYMP